MFQWANGGASGNSRARFAWNPYIALGSNLSPVWNNTNVTTYWNTAGATHETCPTGYRRPTHGIIDGPIPTANPDPAVNSEIFQSLMLKGRSSSNYLGGYYADGFFDRRQITDPPAGSENPGSYSTVSVSNENIAHIGLLTFNSNTLASLFFPLTGIRDVTLNGTLIRVAGSSTSYWTSSSNTTSNSWTLVVSISTMSTTNGGRSFGCPIRCVRPAVPSELIDGIISDPWGTSDTDEKDQWVNW